MTGPEDIRKLALKSLRQQISIVLQDPLLFSGTIADNIRYGRLDASMEEIIEAARAANAHDFVVRLPKQYQTELGDRGAKLSLGERQRVAIARAICKDPALIVFDEATSSLDTAGETVIQAALANLLRGRTAFIIAHRLATVIDADLIVVLDEGQVIQQGTHAELLADRDGLYRKLCLRQFGSLEGPRPRGGPARMPA